MDNSIANIMAEENKGLERWELLEKIGTGAFSNVYRATDRKGNAGDVAIKVARKSEMNNTQRARICDEVRIMRQLDHPNVIKFIDFFESRQYYYMILELASGGELYHQIVRFTYLSEDLSRHVITQVANALEYLHEEKGIVHRDLKLENILYSKIPFIPSRNRSPTQPTDEDKVDEGQFIEGSGSGGIGQIKIADFGLSKIVGNGLAQTPCGTVGYGAPEIINCESYSKSVDMWALGCVLYVLLCGFPPFSGESIEAVNEKVASGQYAFLSPWWDDISRSAQDLISHLLTVNSDRRYTIKDVLNHPWILQSTPSPSEKKRTSEVSCDFDAFKIFESRSSNAVSPREVCDVGTTVYQQDEQCKQRGIPSPLPAGLNDESDGKNNDAKHVHKLAPPQLERRKSSTSRRNQERRCERERLPSRESVYGGHSTVGTPATRRQVSDHVRQKAAFDLSLDGPTLLRRRGIKP